MENLYTNGRYLKTTGTWHAEDAPWKASQIIVMLRKHNLQPEIVAEIGCGTGGILDELSRKPELRDTHFIGYDISPQAIEIANKRNNPRVTFRCEDLLAKPTISRFDLLLAIDVMEHIPDYLGFLRQCQARADYALYHIPLDIHVSSVFRNTLVNNRLTLGHLHYFTADFALAVLRDTGHEIMDSVYTRGALDLFRKHPSLKTFLANIPRRILAQLSIPFTARMLGGYSLLVLTRQAS